MRTGLRLRLRAAILATHPPSAVSCGGQVTMDTVVCWGQKICSSSGQGTLSHLRWKLSI